MPMMMFSALLGNTREEAQVCCADSRTMCLGSWEMQEEELEGD